MSAKDQGESDNVVGLPIEFRFDESSVRAVMRDGDPWFAAKDVCDILELGDPSKTVERLDPDEVGTNSIRTTAGAREMLTVNESGVYSLVFTSRKPEAKRFRKWVTSEVLPEIRKTGGYRRPETQFAGLSGERVEYERWSGCRASASISSGWSRTIRNSARRAPTPISRTITRNSAPTSIDRSIHAPRQTRFCFQPRPETCRILKPTGSCPVA
jgi:prophage antirepressor-like protein